MFNSSRPDWLESKRQLIQICQVSNVTRSYLIYEDGFGVKRKIGTLLLVRQLWQWSSDLFSV